MLLNNQWGKEEIKNQEQHPVGLSPKHKVHNVDEVECQSLSRVRLFVTPGTVACQAPLSMRFSRKEY